MTFDTLTRLFPLKPSGIRVNLPTTFRVQALNHDGKPIILSIPLPYSLNPSMAGLQELIGTDTSLSIVDELFNSRIESHDQYAISLFSDEPIDDDKPIIQWYADALAVFRATWFEIKLLCAERDLIIQSAGLR